MQSMLMWTILCDADCCNVVGSGWQMVVLALLCFRWPLQLVRMRNRWWLIWLAHWSTYRCNMSLVRISGPDKREGKIEKNTDFVRIDGVVGNERREIMIVP